MKPAWHPSEEEWTAWVASGANAEDKIAVHARSCIRCRDSLALFEILHRAGNAGTWTRPPHDIRERGLSVDERPAPGAPTQAISGAWTAADVRGTGSPEQVGARIASGTFAGVRVSVAATPRHADQSWQIRGKLFAPKGGAPIQILLVHGEHVVARAFADDRGEFAFSEPVPSGWVLELHREPDERWTLSEPQP